MTRWRPGLLDVLVAMGLAVLVLGPLLFAEGFVLVGDMVFVPDQPWKDAWTGGDGGVPRAVPSDAWVSLLDSVVPGALLQRTVLVGIFVGAALGTSRLLRDFAVVPRTAGVVLFVWNPYVLERLAIGHWALLCGYAALPWVASAVLDLRRGGGVRSWSLLVAALAVAGWASPTGGVLAVVVALVLCWPSWRRAGATLGVGLGINLPWILPAFLNGADQLPPDPFGVAAFAAFDDTGLGVWGSLLTFGGIWKESVVPDSRGEWAFVLASALVVAAAVAGLWVRRRDPVLPQGPAVGLALGSLLLAGFGAFEFSRPAAEWVVEHVPGGGLVRDGQKWVAPWVLVASVGFAAFVEFVLGLQRKVGGHARVWAVSLVLLPVLAVPSLAWGLQGFLSAEPYPEDWHELRAEMVELGVADDLVVALPFATYRRFDWKARTVLDPAPRFFPGRFVTEDALSVPDGVVGGESALAARIRAATTPEEMAEVLSDGGVRWALVHRSTDEGVLPAGARNVAGGGQVTLLELTEPTGEPGFEGAWRAVTYVVVDLAVLLLVAGFVIFGARHSDKE